MTTALLEGSGRVHNWVRVSWRDHWRPYQAAGIPIVRYEDLLANPSEECALASSAISVLPGATRKLRARWRTSHSRGKSKLCSNRGETGRGKIPPRGQRAASGASSYRAPSSNASSMSSVLNSNPGTTQSTIALPPERCCAPLFVSSFWNRGSLRSGSHSQRYFRSLGVML